jgi:hypothetical protein
VRAIYEQWREQQVKKDEKDPASEMADRVQSMLEDD